MKGIGKDTTMKKIDLKEKDLNKIQGGKPVGKVLGNPKSPAKCILSFFRNCG